MDFGALNYEAILALSPDLIIAVSAGITQDEYDLLSQIAPTIAQSGDYIDFGMPWQEATQLIGDAVANRPRPQRSSPMLRRSSPTHAHESLDWPERRSLRSTTTTARSVSTRRKTCADGSSPTSAS